METFFGLLCFAFAVVMCIKWWKMANRIKQLTADLEALRKHIETPQKETTEMVAILREINQFLSNCTKLLG